MASRTDLQWSIDRFNRFLDRFQRATGIAAEIVVKKYAAEALSRIVQRTPVDTGDARYGWSAAGEALGVKVPLPNERAKYNDPGEYEEQLNGEVKVIRFSNTVPHTIYLEYGWSKQAPLGMVRLTLAELRSGTDISRDLMDELKAAWADTSGAGRYRANRRIMSGMLGAVTDMPLNRKPKPGFQRGPK